MLLMTQPLVKYIKEFIYIVVINGIYVQPTYCTKCNLTKVRVRPTPKRSAILELSPRSEDLITCTRSSRDNALRF